MSYLVGELSAAITGDTSRFDAALSRVERTGEKAAAAIGRRFERLSSTFTQAGGVLSKTFTAPMAAAAAGLGALTVRASNYADEIDKMSIRTQLGTDTLQELRFVTDQVGVEFGSIERAIDGFTRRIHGAAEGTGNAAGVLDRLGVSLMDASGQLRGMDDLFPEVVASLSQVQNETERNALSMQVFGRSASDLTPLLAAGEQGIDQLRARARELGIVMDGDAIKGLVTFKDQMSEVRQQLGMAGMQIATKFLPIIQGELVPIIQDRVIPAISGMIDKIAATVDWYRNLSPAAQTLAKTIAAIAFAAGPVALVIGKILALLPALKVAFLAVASTAGIVVTAIGAIAIAGYQIVKNWEQVKAGFGALWEDIKSIVLRGVGAVLRVLERLPGAARIFPQLRTAMDAVSAAAERQAKKASETRAAFNKLVESNRRAAAAQKATAAGAFDLEKALDSIGDSAANTSVRIREFAQTATDRVAALGVQTIQTSGITLQLRETAAAAFQVISEGADRARYFMAMLGTTIREDAAWAVLQLNDAFAGTVADMAVGFSSLRDGINMLRSAVQGLIRDLIQATLRAAVLSGIRAVFAGSTGGIGGFLLNVAKKALPSFASGGIVSRPMLAQVGDNTVSPEAIVPLHALEGFIQRSMNKVIPNHALAGGQVRTEVQVLQPVIGIQRGELIAWIDQGRRVQRY